MGIYPSGHHPTLSSNWNCYYVFVMVNKLSLYVLIPLVWENVPKAVAVRDQFVRWNLRKHQSCTGVHQKSWKCFAQLQKKYKIERSFSVAKLVYCKARSLAKNLQVHGTTLLSQVVLINYELLLKIKRCWFLLNGVPIWSIFLQLQAVQQSSIAFWPTPYSM